MKMVKKILLWTVIAFIVFAVFKYPTQAAADVQTVWGWVVNLFKSLATFFNSILTTH